MADVRIPIARFRSRSLARQNSHRRMRSSAEPEVHSRHLDQIDPARHKRDARYSLFSVAELSPLGSTAPSSDSIEQRSRQSWQVPTCLCMARPSLPPSKDFVPTSTVIPPCWKTDVIKRTEPR